MDRIEIRLIGITNWRILDNLSICRIFCGTKSVSLLSLYTRLPCVCPMAMEETGRKPVKNFEMLYQQQQ